jgi:hypothetical protein
LNWKEQDTAEKTPGIKVPPEKPCKTRHAISIAKLPLAAQPNEASVKTAIASTNSQRIVRARVRRPVNGIAITSAIR